MNHVNIAKLNVRRLGCKHGFLSMQYSKLPFKNLANCTLERDRQIYGSYCLPLLHHEVSVTGQQACHVGQQSPQTYWYSSGA